MLTYFIILFIPAVKAYYYSNYSISNHLSIKKYAYYFIFLVLIIGFRYEVGGDWVSYLIELENTAEGQESKEGLYYMARDPVYDILYKLAVESNTGIYLVNIVSAIVFSYGLIKFCQYQKNPWLAITVSIPYLVTVVAMGYTRQSSAIGIVMLAIIELLKANKLKFIIYIIIASLFHKSAVLLVFISLLGKSKNTILNLCLVLIVSFLLYIFILEDSINSLIHGYIENEYNSSGALIRIILIIIPSMIFILFRKKFKISNSEYVFWTWISITSIFFLYLFIISPSSTAVDRVALYWIPVQIFVYSNIPNAISSDKYLQRLATNLIIIKSFFLQFGWLIFADTSFAWLPYKFYPLEILIGVF